MQGRLVSGSWTPQCLLGSKTLPAGKKAEFSSGRSHQATLSLALSKPPSSLHYISLNAPALLLFVRQQSPPGGPACNAFVVPTNRTDVAHSDKSLLTGSTGSLTRVNCDCQPGETIAPTPSAAALMRGIQRVDFSYALIP